MRKLRNGDIQLNESELDQFVAKKVAEKLAASTQEVKPQVVRFTESELLDKIEAIVEEVQKETTLTESRNSRTTRRRR